MTLPVIDPASLLPRPQALEDVDYEAYWTAWLMQMLLLMPGYNVANRKSDPGVIVSRAFTYIRILDRVRVNEAYAALRLALAEDADLDGLAADRGVTRLVYAPATATSAAVVQDDDSLRLTTWLTMQEWSLGSSCLGVEGRAWKLALPDVSDVSVFDFPGEGRMRCVLLPRPGLDPAALPTLLARVGGGLNARGRRPGSVYLDVVLAEVLTFDVAVTIGVLGGASRLAAKTSAETAITAYTDKRRKIGVRVATSLIEKQAAVTNVGYAHLTSFSSDLLPGREQAYQMGSLNVTTEDARG